MPLPTNTNFRLRLIDTIPWSTKWAAQNAGVAAFCNSKRVPTPRRARDARNPLVLLAFRGAHAAIGRGALRRTRHDGSIDLAACRRLVQSGCCGTARS